MSTALSIRQPWASLIVSGVKDVENRSWLPPRSLIGRRFYVHAARRLDDVPGYRRVARTSAREMIVGSVVLDDVVEDCSSRWALSEYRWHWLLVDPHALDEPIPCTGARRLWTVPASVMRRLNAERACLGH